MAGGAAGKLASNPYLIFVSHRKRRITLCQKIRIFDIDLTAQPAPH